MQTILRGAHWSYRSINVLPQQQAGPSVLPLGVEDAADDSRYPGVVFAGSSQRQEQEIQFVLQWTPVQTILEKSDWLRCIGAEDVSFITHFRKWPSWHSERLRYLVKTKANELAEA